MDSEECNDVLNHSSDPSIAELEGNVQQVCYFILLNDSHCVYSYPS